MQFFDHRTKTIAFRIVPPVVSVIILTAGILYFFGIKAVSDFAEQHIQRDLLSLSHEVYNKCDKNLTELLQEGLSSDEIAVIIKKANTLDDLEGFAIKNGISLMIYSDDKEITKIGFFDKAFFNNTAKKEGQVSTTKFQDKKYYTNFVTFQPWNWQILLAKDPVGYNDIQDKVALAYIISTITLIIAAFFLIWSLKKAVIDPMQSIIGSLNKGTAPDYKGTKEIEFLSDSISNMMGALKERVEELLKAEDAIRFNETILNSVNDVIFVVEADSLKITNVNKLFLKVYKTTEKDIIGKTCYEIVHNLPVHCLNCHAVDILAKGVSLTYEKTIPNKKGKLRYLEVSASPIKDKAGNITHLVFISRDVSERKRLEEQLSHSQRLEAIGILVGGIAHDFNNILTAIIGYGNLLQMKIEKESPLYRYVDQILTSSEKGAELVRNLLAYSRKQIINPVPLNLNQTVNKVKELLKRLLEENIELKINTSDDEVTVMADPVQIEQVLMNLATNARDAMPNGGSIMIETAPFEIDKNFINTYSYGKIGKYGRISFTDTGEGIQQGIMDKIFDPFFTTKKTGKGTGLGLSMVYGIIKQHKGFINVFSETGKGTTFSIYLPLIESNVGETADIESSKKTAFGFDSSETILIAEDEDFVRDLQTEVLRKFGYKVLTASDGEEALQIFKEHEDEIGLVLTDIVMPKKNGWELFEDIRKIKSDMKFLLISGYSQDLQDKKKMLDKEVHFISKPISPGNLLIKVREILHEPEKYNQRF